MRDSSKVIYFRISIQKKVKLFVNNVTDNFADNKARLKNMLVCRHPGLLFRVHPSGRENFFLSF